MPPMQSEHIVIVNPTKFLGNLLIALGVLQETCNQFDASGQAYSLILDEAFKPIVDGLFKPGKVIYYPRKILKNSGALTRLQLYSKFIGRLRSLKAGIAVDLEGDSVSSTLTRLSGAKKRIGPAGCTRESWYHQLSTPKIEMSEFYKYRNVLARIANVENSTPYYGKLISPEISAQLSQLLNEKGIADFGKMVVLHAGASKARKLWPTQNWIALANALQDQGFKPVLVGAGDMDVKTNNEINGHLKTPIPDLANSLCLVSLSQLIGHAKFYIGNDSGPMHLATALGVPGIALFGPTKDKLWGPLLPSTVVMRGYQCPESCRNGHDCELALRCLTDLQPQTVMQQFLTQLN